jgi:sec-independent protein translocase protein TatB
MVVLFIVVLVVFGPQKLPELARGLGKLMAEFRKASTDFRTAFEEEMRDIERQALQAERRKAAEAAAAGQASQPAPPEALPSESTLNSEPVTDTTWPTPAAVAATDAPANGTESGTGVDTPAGPTVTPIAEAVARTTDSGEPADAVKPELLPAESHENSISDSQKAS